MLYKLLIVDDEVFVADSLSKYVNWNDVGFEVVATAYDADMALDIIKNQKVDVLLTDIIMGDKTGLWLIEHAIEIQNDLKCIIISGHEQFDYAKTAIKLGVYDYLTKPVDFDELEQLFLELNKKMSKNNDSLDETINQSEDDKEEGIIINNVKKYIDIHYGEEIHLNNLAEQVYVHPTYLSILFKKKTGSNFKDYVTKVRMEKAKEMLKDLSLRISDISNNVGYESSKHFSKVFKKEIGVTPKDYRNNF